MTVKSCPDAKTLELLLTGRLPCSQAEELEEHLLGCDECLASVRTISPNDDLAAAIQSRREFTGDEDVLAEAIERAKQLRSQAETVETDETILAKTTPQADHEARINKIAFDEEIDFLAPAEQPDEIGRLGDYRVLEVLGVGGMGVVFRAEDPKLERQIALKAMKPALAVSRSAKDRFLREAKATAAIEHDNIVQIYQVSEDRNVPFIAMPFLRGESLQKRLERGGKLDQRLVTKIGREVADGLQSAHEHGLIHRDIKPDNIWLEQKREGGKIRSKILDFGLARTHEDDSGLTQTGMVLGTPKYMAPEQAQGQTVDHRCDLFSLGSVLYHLASGKAPFGGGNLTATLLSVAQADCQAIQEVCDNLHPDLAKLITRLLSKDRGDRPQSAAEVAKTLAGIEKTLDEEAARLAAEEAERVKQQQVAETTVLDKSPVAEPQPQHNSRAPIFFGGAVAAIALAVFVWLWASGVIFKVETKDGTLIVKVMGDDFATSVQGQVITIRNTETDETFKIDLKSSQESKSLNPGEYKFELTTDSGLTTKTDHFTISSGRDQVVEVFWETKQQVAKAESGSEDVRSVAMAAGQSGRERNYALEFDGKDDYVDIPTLKNDGYDAVTIEMTVRPKAVHDETLLIYGWGTRSMTLAITGGSKWFTGRTFENGGWGKTVGKKALERERTNLAAVWDGKRITLFINGERQGGGTDRGFDTHKPPATIDGLSLAAAFKADNTKFLDYIGYFHGIIDEVRISTIARYTEDFKPAERFENDEHTLALYHFDEGQGDTLIDSSRNGHDGKIVGAKWVRVDDELEVIEKGQPADPNTYSWPTNQPAPAIAPFDAEQAKTHQEAWAKHLGVDVEITNSIGMKFRVIPPGEFLMGSSEEEIAKLLEEAKEQKLDRWYRERISNEGPQHKVTLTKPFGLAIHEVTRGQFRQFVEATGFRTDAEKDGKGGYGYKDGHWAQAPQFLWNTNLGFEAEQTDDHPVVNVSWNDAVAFCIWSSEKEGVTYRLPTEAEWEFACRAGSLGRFSFGDDHSKLADYAWFGTQGGRNTKPVGLRASNPLGLLDVHGNAWEWCGDEIRPYDAAHAIDPVGPKDANGRVLRGGSFNYDTSLARSALRSSIKPDDRNLNLSFRPAITFEKYEPTAAETEDEREEANAAAKQDAADE